MTKSIASFRAAVVELRALVARQAAAILRLLNHLANPGGGAAPAAIAAGGAPAPAALARTAPPAAAEPQPSPQPSPPMLEIAALARARPPPPVPARPPPPPRCRCRACSPGAGGPGRRRRPEPMMAVAPTRAPPAAPARPPPPPAAAADCAPGARGPGARGKLFEDADCDGEVAAFQAGASENIQYTLLPAVHPCLPRLCIACSDSDSGEDLCEARVPRVSSRRDLHIGSRRDLHIGSRRDSRAAAHGETCTSAHGETAARRLTARQPRGGSRRDSRAAAHGETAARRLTARPRGTAARPHGRTGIWPRGRCPPVSGGSRRQLTERQPRGAGRWQRAVPARQNGRAVRQARLRRQTAARWLRARWLRARGLRDGLSPDCTAARQRCGAAMRREGRAAVVRMHGMCVARLARQPRGAGRWLRAGALWLRGETAAREDGRATVARRDGRMARWPIAMQLKRCPLQNR
jgi:hypothetical protein